MSLHPPPWLDVKPAGLFCQPGQFYVDPRFPVDAAVITHGHGDHARGGHNKVLATPETIAIMKLRYGEECAAHLQSLSYGESIKHNGVEISLIPAGHILGSAQIILTYQGERVIVSGDFKRRPDPTCLPFTVAPCDVFITEATFGLPVFIHPPIENELAKLLSSLAHFPERAHLLGAYALGKCQRVMMSLRQLGYADPIYLHGALQKLCELYIKLGVDLGPILPASELTEGTSSGKLILCPPSALRDRWSRRFGDAVIANASGWMQIRARAKQQHIELPLIISDHADWNELITTIKEVNAKQILVTHGREDALVHQATLLGFTAHALNILKNESEDEDE